MRNLRSEKLIRKRKRSDGLDKFPESCSTYNKRVCSSNNRTKFPLANGTFKRCNYSPYPETFLQANETPKRSDYSPYPETFLQVNETPKRYDYSPYSETFFQANGTPKKSNYSPYYETFCQVNRSPKKSDYSPYPETFLQVNETPKRYDYSPYSETFCQVNGSPKKSDYSPYPETFLQATAFNCTRDYETTALKDKCTMQLPYQLRTMNNYRYQNENETLSVKGVPWYSYYEKENFPYKRRKSSQASGRPRKLNYSRYPQATSFNSTNYHGTNNARDNYMAQFPYVEDSINNHFATDNEILPIQGVQEQWHQYNLGIKEYLEPSNTIVSETDSKIFDKDSLPGCFLNPTPKSKNSSYYPSNELTPLYDCYWIDPSSEHILQSLEKDKIQNKLTDKVSFSNNYFSNSTGAQTPSSSNHDRLLLDPNENQKSAESVSNNTISPCMKDTESVFMYSNILNTDIFLSEFETSLNSITNYILNEPKYSESPEESCGKECKNSLTYHENVPDYSMCPQVENTTGKEKDNASEVKHLKVDDMKMTSNELINDMFNFYLWDISESDDSKITSSEFINEISYLYLGDIFKADTSECQSSKNNQINKSEDKSYRSEKDVHFNEETVKMFITDNHNDILQVVPKDYPKKCNIEVQTKAENHLLKCDVSIQTETKSHCLTRSVSIQTEIQKCLLKCDASIQTESKNHKLQHDVSIQTETKNRELKHGVSIQTENHSFERDVSIQIEARNHPFKQFFSIQKETNNRPLKYNASIQTGIKDFHTSSSGTNCNNFHLCPKNLVKNFNNVNKDPKVLQRTADNVKPNEICKPKTKFKANNNKYKIEHLKKHPQKEVANYLKIFTNLSINSNNEMTETTYFQKKLLSEETKEFETDEANSRYSHENIIETSNIETYTNTPSIKKFKNRTDQTDKREDISFNENMSSPQTTERLIKIRAKIEKIDCKKLRRSPRLKKIRAKTEKIDYENLRRSPRLNKIRAKTEKIDCKKLRRSPRLKKIRAKIEKK